MNDIKVLCVPTSNAGVSQWRIQNWVEAAFRNKAGFFHNPWHIIDLTEIQPWETGIETHEGRYRFLGELDQKIRQADIVVMQMVHYPGGMEVFRAIRTMYPHIPVVSEIDDNMMSTADYNPAFPFYAPGNPCRDFAIEQFKNSDAMIVSTPYLAEVYSEFCDHIYVMENSIDVRVWDRVRRKSKPGVRIGWAGGASHDQDLKIIEPVVKSILEKNKDVTFCFVHGVPDFLKNIPRVEFIRKFARIDKYPQHIANQAWDISLAPLVDNAFNRGKSNIRWLESAALGIPCVASNVGHFKQTITHGVDGLLAEPHQFEAEIQSLISDKKKRKAMGQAANKTARESFNVDKNIFKYVDALKEVLARGALKPMVTKDYLQRPLGAQIDQHAITSLSS